MGAKNTGPVLRSSLQDKVRTGNWTKSPQNENTCGRIRLGRKEWANAKSQGGGGLRRNPRLSSWNSSSVLGEGLFQRHTSSGSQGWGQNVFGLHILLALCFLNLICESSELSFVISNLFKLYSREELLSICLIPVITNKLRVCSGQFSDQGFPWTTQVVVILFPSSQTTVPPAVPMSTPISFPVVHWFNLMHSLKRL